MAKSFLIELEKYYLNDELSDVVFVFKNQDGTMERLPSHKFALAVASEVFKAMYYGSLKEETHEISIVDVSAESFKEFLQFFYFKRPKLSMTCIAEVMYLGHKYDVQRSMEVCEDFLIRSITNDEMCLGFELAVRYKCDTLKSLCDFEIRSNTSKILSSTTFPLMEVEILTEMLDVNPIKCSEYEIFRACISWAKAACHLNELDSTDPLSLRSQIEPLLRKIRFRSITVDELNEIFQSHSKLFTREELEELIRMRSLKFEPKILCGLVRLCSPEPNPNIKCGGPPERDGYRDIDEIETVTFTSSKAIWLVELQFAAFHKYTRNHYGSYNYSAATISQYATVKSKLEIMELIENEDENMQLIRLVGELKGGQFIETMKLQPIIYIKPNTTYEIKVTFSDRGSLCVNNQNPGECIVKDNTKIAFRKTSGLIKAFHFNPS